MSTPHPLVTQLRFTRGEFVRGLKRLSEDDAARRFEPMNCISWNVGHLAWQEQEYFIFYGLQEPRPYPDIARRFAYGAPSSTPSLAEMREAWESITAAADPYLDALTAGALAQPFLKADGSPGKRLVGSLLYRVIYHYWYHTGENAAIRQMLGHERLPQFVGNIDGKAPYTAP